MNSQPEKAVGLRRRTRYDETLTSSAQADGFFWLRIHSPEVQPLPAFDKPATDT